MTDDGTIYVYPSTGDWEAWVAERCASILRPDPQFQVLLGMVEPFRVIEDTNEQMAFFQDVDAAAGVWLDRIGRRFGENRSGLGDAEYRRIIKAAQAASTAEPGVETIWEVWLILADVPEADASISEWPNADPNTVRHCVKLSATIEIPPSASFVKRAGVVLRALVTYDRDISATLLLPDSIRDQGPLPWGDTTWPIGVT